MQLQNILFYSVILPNIRPISQRFCDVAFTVKFYCACDVAKSLRNGPIMFFWWRIVVFGRTWIILFRSDLTLMEPDPFLWQRISSPNTVIESTIAAPSRMNSGRTWFKLRDTFSWVVGRDHTVVHFRFSPTSHTIFACIPVSNHHPIAVLKSV